MRSRFLFPVLLVATLAACDSKTEDPGVGGTGGAGGAGGTGGVGGTGGGELTECGGANVLELVGSSSSAVLEAMTDTRDAWDGLCAPDLSYGNDVIVKYRAAEEGFYHFSTAGSDVETVLFAVEDCQDGFSQIACGHGNQGGEIVLWLDEGKTVYLVVDTVNEKVSQPFKLTGSKSVLRRPTIDEVTTFANPSIAGAIAVRLSGSNPDGPLVGYTMQLFGTDGQALLDRPLSQAFDHPDSFLEVEQGGGTFRVTGVVSYGGQAPPFSAIELTMHDANGLWSVANKSMARAPVVVGRGDECDMRLLFTTCGANEGCVQPDTSASPYCAGTPLISKVTATKNLVTGTWGLIVEGTDADGDAASARVRPKDARGRVIAVGGASMTPVPFHRIGHDSTGAFRGVVALEARFDSTCETPTRRAFDSCVAGGAKDPATCEAERVQQLATCLANTLESIVKVDLEVVDATGLISRMSTSIFTATQEGVPGDACDPYGAIGYCPASLVCWSEDDLVPEICQANGPTCPDSYATIDLADHAATEGWSFSGSLADAELSATASCGGGGKTRVFSFSAPEAGVYSFETSALGAGVDTVLSVRRFCQLPGYEIACSDDAGAGKASRVELELGGGESVFALVGAKVEGSAGAFTLSVVREDSEPEVLP